jgi:zinc D-Ala-D-Ala dipeptidase
MIFHRFMQTRLLGCLVVLFAGLALVQAQENGSELVDLAQVDKTIVIDLRYATKRNIARRPIYPDGTRCLIRRGVAERLRYAQHLLRERGYGLKIWDAFRPAYAQQILFKLIRDGNFIADPKLGGSVHTWGAAVDATLVNSKGREMRMPTDFDEITPAASMYYTGADTEIIRNLRLLQGAMGSAGFYGTKHEWWHFTAKDWTRFGPVRVATAERPVASVADTNFHEHLPAD